MPRLGGQHAEYIVVALKGYQAGDRAHPTMHANAFSLSDEDMADIAAYVAGFGPLAKAIQASACSRIASLCSSCCVVGLFQRV